MMYNIQGVLHIGYNTSFFHSNYMLDTDTPIAFNNVFMSTTGVKLKRAKENAKCCENNYIESSEDGTETRWPVVSAEPICVDVDGEKVCSRCSGGVNKSFQQWIDDAATSDPPEGLCVGENNEGWLYAPAGILMK